MKGWLLTTHETLRAMKEADIVHASDRPAVGIIFEDGGIVAEYRVNDKAEEYARFRIDPRSVMYFHLTATNPAPKGVAASYREFYDRKEKASITIIKDDPQTLELVDAMTVVSLRYSLAVANNDKLNVTLRVVCREQAAKAKYASTIAVLDQIRLAGIPMIQYQKAMDVVTDTLSYDTELVKV